MQLASGMLPSPCLRCTVCTCVSASTAFLTPTSLYGLLQRSFHRSFLSKPFRVSVGRDSGGKLSIVASLGFIADPRNGIERAANRLLKDAAGLLVYQDVLRSTPAQAFLKVIASLRRGDDEWKLLEAYGDFYNLMMVGRHPSWEDLILEGILSGEKNPFAEAAANVGNPSSIWSGCIPPSLRAAAAADLDSLQRLSVTESTLVGWVADLVTDVRPEWRAAAEANLSSRAIRKVSYPSLEERRKNHGFTFLDSDDNQKPSSSGNGAAADGSATNSQLFSENSEYQNDILVFREYRDTDVLASERETWRKKIGGLWRWSEALPLLEKYYAQYNAGRIASAQALRCQGGKLARDFKFCIRSNNLCDLSIHNGDRQLLLRNFRKHASGSAPKHVLVCGPNGSGKTWLVKSVLRSLACKGEIRVVNMPKGELEYLNGLLEELAKAWQLRFVLLVDDVFLKVGEDSLYILKSAINGTAQEWPANVLLCVTGHKTNLTHEHKSNEEETPLPVNFDDIFDTISQMEVMDARKQMADTVESLLVANLNDIFGTIIHLEKLDIQTFLKCIQEIIKHRQSNGVLTCDLHDEDIMQQARDWAKHRDSLSVQAAAQFIDRLL